MRCYSDMQEEKFYEELLGLSLLRIDLVEKQPTKLIVHCSCQSESGRCPQCGSVTAVVNQYDKRQVARPRHIRQTAKPPGGMVTQVPQFVCHTCQRYFTESPDWPAPRWVQAGKSYTKRHAKWVFELCAKQPFTEVGSHRYKSQNGREALLPASRS